MWPFSSKSGSTSGNTATVVSGSIRLIKEQLIDATYHASGEYSHKEKTQYSIVLVTEFSDGITTQSQLTSHSTDEEMANKMFDFYVKSNGNYAIKEVLKEAKIEI